MDLVIGMPNTYFELYKDAAGKFRFRLKAANGETIAVGEAYESKSGCENGIESVKKNAPLAIIKDITINISDSKNVNVKIQVNYRKVTIKNIDESFQKATNLIKERRDVSKDFKREIQKNLNSIKEELKKSEPEIGKVKKTLHWLKNNANWIIPVIVNVVSDFL